MNKFVRSAADRVWLPPEKYGHQCAKGVRALSWRPTNALGRSVVLVMPAQATLGDFH